MTDGWPTYDGERLRHFAMPLGGIGTGTVALAGTGGLRQWQLHNTGNHLGSIPDSFFAIRVSQWEPPFDELRLLQAPGLQPTNTPLVNDDAVPPGEARLHEVFTPMRSASVEAVYPVARTTYDTGLPLGVQLEAFNPLVPLDADDSARPVAALTFTLTNDGEQELHGWLGGALQNAVGWDGVTPIDGVACPLYGGNTNHVRRWDGWTAAVLENHTLPAEHPGAGQLVLATDGAGTQVLPQWTRPEQFKEFLSARPATVNVSAHGPSADGTTWNAGLAAPFQLAPGEAATIRFLLGWQFPNRYVDFVQFGPKHDYGHSRFWLGNDYSSVLPDAMAQAEVVAGTWDDQRAATLRWAEAFASSTLPGETGARLAALAADVRSPTVFRDADGRVLGFEGVAGASTGMWGSTYGGSCPLNCTHVWNYEQTMSRVWPDLSLNMRDTEFDVMQAAQGYVPHRLIVPSYHRQLWDVNIGGPDTPALDGMLGTVLKSYREVRQGAGLDWLERRWPSLVRLLDHIRTGWDPKGTGVLRGIQPSTHDIDLCGVNSFMGTYWLAALRAGEEMASLLGATGEATELRELFGRGSTSYDEILFTGEYYRQVLDDGDNPEFQWDNGVLADQLIGQWWAHQLDLGHLLPAEHVRTALQAVLRHNLRTGFEDFSHPYRVFADGADTGLLMCSWPYGGRPEVPTRYADEVWTGSEQQVAAHCLYEGLVDEGLAVLRGMWGRYDGSRRNPFNPIECGDHYIRNAAGWSVLEALAGFRYDAVAGSMSFAPLDVARSAGGWRLPFVAGTGWGVAEFADDTLTLHCHGGRLDLRSVQLDGTDRGPCTVDAGNTVRV